jgi:hypothetical protein
MMEVAAVVVMGVVVVEVKDVVAVMDVVVVVAEILIQLPRAGDLVLQVLEVQAVAETMLKV